MNIIYYLVPAALIMGIFFILGFIWTVKSGQYEDLETPAVRMLIDEEKK